MSKPMSLLVAALAAGLAAATSSAASAGCLACGCGAPAIAYSYYYYYYGGAFAPCVPPRPVFVVNQGPVYSEVVPLAAYHGPAYVYGRPYPYLAGHFGWSHWRAYHQAHGYAYGPR